MLATDGDMPAPVQRMTANVSCMAWLPRISAATNTTRRNTDRRRSSAMSSREIVFAVSSAGTVTGGTKRTANGTKSIKTACSAIMTHKP